MRSSIAADAAATLVTVRRVRSSASWVDRSASRRNSWKTSSPMTAQSGTLTPWTVSRWRLRAFSPAQTSRNSGADPTVSTLIAFLSVSLGSGGDDGLDDDAEVQHG